MNNLNDIITSSLVWEKDSSNSFISFFKGNKYYLKFNDFPEEPLITIYCKTFKEDLDEIPKYWTVKY